MFKRQRLVQMLLAVAVALTVGGAVPLVVQGWLAAQRAPQPVAADLLPDRPCVNWNS